MAQIYKEQVEFEIKSQADKLFEAFTTKPYLIAKGCPKMVSSVELVEGDGKTIGSVYLWKYAIGKTYLNTNMYTYLLLNGSPTKLQKWN